MLIQEKTFFLESLAISFFQSAFINAENGDELMVLMLYPHITGLAGPVI